MLTSDRRLVLACSESAEQQANNAAYGAAGTQLGPSHVQRRIGIWEWWFNVAPAWPSVPLPDVIALHAREVSQPRRSITNTRGPFDASQ